MYNSSKFPLLMLGLLMLGLGACKKYLDAKPDQRMTTPDTLADLQAILDQSDIMNLQHPSLGEVSADNYWLTDADYDALKPYEQAAYRWLPGIYTGYPNDWSMAYNPVYYANLALEQLANIGRTADNAAAWDNVKGCALYYRATGFLEAVWLWSRAYDPATAATDPGIPLRLSPDFHDISERGTVAEVYRQALGDLQQAAVLLPGITVHQLRPGKTAAWGWLARAYLSMNRMDSCLFFSNQALGLQHELLDYNSIDPNNYNPFDLFNREVVHHTSMFFGYSNLFDYQARVDTGLYAAYDPHDLRRNLFFGDFGDGTHYFRGSYGNYLLFNGLAVDELYLMRAEAEAILGDESSALDDMNTLLASRFEAGTYSPHTAADTPDLLNFIRLERRKSLLFRNLRWVDIKRMNAVGAGLLLKRVVNGVTVSLLPGANQYALPIPPEIIDLSGMVQNPG